MRLFATLVSAILYLNIAAIPETPRQICNRFAESHGARCAPEVGMCYLAEFSMLVDSCLVGMFYESPDIWNASVTEWTPDRDQFNRWPSATIPPANFTQYHPLYGSMTGYEEPNYHLGMLPQDPSVLDTHLTYHAVDSSHRVPALQPHKMVEWMGLGMQPDRIFIVSHDFNNAYLTSPIFMSLITSLIDYQSQESSFKNPVIVVDSEVGFRAGLNGTFYKQAAANAILIGRQVGVFIYQLAESGIDPLRIHLIGYGLGAHMPQFGESPHILLTDARRVDVITTSAGFNVGLGEDPLYARYGMAQEVGHRQFYPNAGHTQPGCDGERPSPVDGIPGFYESSSMCSHAKVLQYFTYSLQPSADRRRLTAKAAPSWDDYVQQAVTSPWGSRWDRFADLGIDAFADDGNLKGSYYLALEMDRSNQALLVSVDWMRGKDEASKDENRLLQVPPFYYSEETFTQYPLQAVPARATHHRDPPSCGKFRSTSNDSRIFRGQLPYEGQFPWVVCILKYKERQHQWGRICTGAILSDTFILTAAHCFNNIADGTPLYITYGTNDCMKPPPGMYKKVIFEYYNTVIGWDKFDENMAYDVGLIRLVDPIRGLPGANYGGELINTICLHANQQYNNSNWLEYMYVAGFGGKGLAERDNANLTWTYASRTQRELEPEYAELFFNFYGFSLVDHYYNRKWYTTCPGDSGASYAWYINTHDEPKENVSDYRAVTVSIVKSGIESCEFRYHNDLTGLGVGADNAINVREEAYIWITSKMAAKYYNEDPEESAETYHWPLPPFRVAD
ncbi:Pancreatic triacylglycerol lipase [Halotydeus destructor]|nr:Pancreatic triacylglycerol lipase [Halotydeus destructor]